MAMSRTESLGTPLAESLRRRADEVREARRAAAAERARKASVKMLFPLVFMILPAFLLLTVVPVLLSTLLSVRLEEVNAMLLKLYVRLQTLFFFFNDTATTE